jgi:hypothetical protein
MSIFGCLCARSSAGIGAKSARRQRAPLDDARCSAPHCRGMKITWLFAFSVISISVAQVGCSSSDSSPGGSAGATGSAGNSAGSGGNSGASTSSDFPPLTLDADIRTLSDADKGKLCDWMNAKLGGYGLATHCTPAINVSNDDNQAQCVATFFRAQCKITPAQVEACILDEAPSHACDRGFDSCKPLLCQ